MKRNWILAWTAIAALAASSTVAQDRSVKSTESTATPQQEQRDDRITVNVWSSALTAEPESAKISTQFAAAGLNAAFNMESMERRIENSLRSGLPLGESWINSDLETIDHSIRVAELCVAGDADRKALRELENQSARLRVWSNWLIEQNRRLGLAEYYISSSALDNDERFAKSVACTKLLVSTFASRTVADNNSCL